MVISNILGGLGNQMFQYAVGRSLALKRSDEFKLDVSGFARYKLHQGFELNRVFNCMADIDSKADVRRVLGWQAWPGVKRILSRPAMEAVRRKKFVVEPHPYYWPGINDVPTETYLSGYWQSEIYFREAAREIRSDFTFKIPMNERNAELADRIRNANAISLHVRRGDYVSNSKTTATHGVCSLEYYESAIQHIASQCEQPCFFIFSDDADWVRENLKIDFPCVYVDHNLGAESYNDMRLMSLCRHHIIANSSFSWWGAWLNCDMNKIVVAPRKWFANERDVTDLLPASWVKL